MSNREKSLGNWPNAPLALVLAQVRFDTEVHTEYKDIAERLRTAFGEQFPALKSVRQYTQIFGASPVATENTNMNPVEVGLELRRDNDRGALRIMNGVMTYTTSIYEESRVFLGEWRTMLECLCGEGSVKVLSMGMRYVDFIIPSGDKTPEQYFKNGLGHSTEIFGENADTVFLSYEYKRSDHGAIRIQYGRGFAQPSLPPDLEGTVLLPPALQEKYKGGPSAVLDMDRFNFGSRRMKAEEISSEFKNIRDDICTTFTRIITDEAQAEWSGK